MGILTPVLWVVVVVLVSGGTVPTVEFYSVGPEWSTRIRCLDEKAKFERGGSGIFREWVPVRGPFLCMTKKTYDALIHDLVDP